MDAPIPAAVGPPPRRFVHRIPVRLRQHWKLLATLVVVAVGLTAAFGSTRIQPYITGDVTLVQSAITDNIAGTVDLFDSTVPHTVVIDVTDAEYHQMISAYEKDGDKKWVTADVTIDGTLINDAAIRLKGNSTLLGLRGDDARPPGAPEGGGPMGPGAGDGDLGPPGGMVSASADDPTTLPLLISFDENADGRGYQGLTELSVRPGTPVLNEALALSLTAATNQPTQRYAYAAYTINGQTTTRLLLEHPDELYANTLFDSNGYLYKADAGSRFEYVGPDQSAYADQFKQINATDNGNLQPIINVLAWLADADDAEFDEHLSDWVDTVGLARYLATQNLLSNADDMGGPGQNYYLWYDLDTGLLSVVSWDLNLAMNGKADTVPGEPVQMGLPEGKKLPEGAQPGGGPPPHAENALKSRFLASEVWMQTYDEVYWELYDQTYGAGRAMDVLDDVVETIPVTDGLPASDLATAADQLRGFVAQRTEFLEGQQRD